MKKILAALLSIMLTLAMLANVSASNAEVFDGAPCLKLLINMVNSIAAANYDSFSWNLWWFSQVEPPENIAYIHNKTGCLMRELALNLREYENRRSEALKLALQGKCLEAEQHLEEAKAFFVKAYSTKVKLVDEELLEKYVRTMLTYVNSSSEKFMLKRDFDEALANLVNYVEALRLEVVELESEVALCKAREKIGLNIYVSPATVEAGGNISVSGEILGALTGNNTYFIVSLRIGGTVASQQEIPGTQKFNITLPVPDAEKLPSLMRGKGKYFAEARVVVTYFSGNTVLAYNDTEIKIVAYKPTVIFECPTSTRYNESIVVPVKARIKYPLNVTVYFDGEKVLSETLYPTTSKLNLGWNSGFTLGYHTLTFEVAGRGRYVSTKYSCSLAIIAEQPSFDIVVDYVSLYPFSGVKVVGEIVFPKPVEHVVEIVLNGEKKDVIVGSGERQSLNVTVAPTPPLIIGFGTVEIRVYNPMLGVEFKSEHPVIVVNTLGLMGALLMLLLALMLPPRRDIIELPVFFVEKLRGVLLRRVLGGREYSVEHLVIVRKAFRPSKLAPIYYGVLEKISRIVGGIRPSETLREYLWRVERKLKGKTLALFKKITVLFEKDLYSRQGVSEEEVLEAMKIREELEGEA